jgi:hypothetical protein
MAYAYSAEYRDYIDLLSWEVNDMLLDFWAEMDPQSRPSHSFDVWNIQALERVKKYDRLVMRAAEALPGYVPDSERPCLRKAVC